MKKKQEWGYNEQRRLYYDKVMDVFQSRSGLCQDIPTCSGIQIWHCQMDC